MLLEDEAPLAERQRRLEQFSGSSTIQPVADLTRKSGEPSASELLQALQNWIETDIKPQSAGRDRFMAAVAMNTLGILQREAQMPFDIHDRSLASDILSGRKTLNTPGLLAQLKDKSLQKLAADQPKYSALTVARQKWTQ